MEMILLFSTVLAPIVLAFVQLVKNTGVVSKKILPLVAVVIGLLIGFASFPFSDLDLALRLWAGAIAGLAATGLFELTLNKNNKGGL